MKSASPVVNATGTTLVAGSASYSPSSFVGTTPAYATARDYDIASGAMFTTQDVKQHAASSSSARPSSTNLFAGQDPVGQSLRVDGTSFRSSA